MCGRFTRTSPRPVLQDEFGITEVADIDLEPRYNIAPSLTVEAIIRTGEARRLGPLRWGFTAASGTGPTPINARAETVATSPLFREAFRRHRCLVVADGFYEWRREGRRTIPYYIHLRSGRPFGFAGIWSVHRTAAGARVGTCAIITCPANELVAQIHTRMPVIVPAPARDRWLDPYADLPTLRETLVPLPAEEMEAYEVSTLVNSPHNDSAECVARLTPA
jgi:putative SOS response-associated peptidase YedK